MAYIPNIITFGRLLGTVIMAFTTPFSFNFFLVYTLTGFSDVLDGFIARMTGTTSVFGAKLDSAADLLFYTVMFFMIFPTLFGMLPIILWVLFLVVMTLRVVAYATCAAKHKKFAATHSILNKITGAAVFSTPYIMQTDYIVGYCTVMGVISLVAAIKELVAYISVKKV